MRTSRRWWPRGGSRAARHRRGARREDRRAAPHRPTRPPGRAARRAAAGVLELPQVPDLGPKKMAALHAALGITCRAEPRGGLPGRPGARGEGLRRPDEQRILESMGGLARRAEPRMLLSDALDLGDAARRHLRRRAGGPHRRSRARHAGWRRRSRTSPWWRAPRPSRRGGRQAGHLPRRRRGRWRRTRPATTVRLLASGVRVDLRVVAPEDHATRCTASPARGASCPGCTTLARERGYDLSERGLARLDGEGTVLRVATEEELYAELGLPYIPPELREGEGEVEAAPGGRAPGGPGTLGDVRGMVHCHTRWSDGRATIEEMALAAEAARDGVPHHHRPLAVGALRGRADRRPPAGAVGRDRAGAGEGADPAPPRHGVGHHRGGRARLPRSRAGASSTS